MTQCLTAQFEVEAEADPQVLLRLLGLFAQRWLTPSHVTMSATAHEVRVMIRQAGLSQPSATMIAERMRSGPFVRQVTLSLSEASQ